MDVLAGVYYKLFQRFGAQHWWPGETPFEVAVGALLTQNTAWTNAAMAINRLKEKKLLNPRRLLRVRTRQLALLIRPSGYFNQKAKRLKTFVKFLCDRYGGRMDRLREVHWQRMRKELLMLPGIGPETADSILLYALEKPTFVVDAYTRRILARHSLIDWKASYDEIRSLFLERMPVQVKLFNEYHALLVATGKSLCLSRHPRCHECPILRVGKLRLEPTAK